MHRHRLDHDHRSPTDGAFQTISNVLIIGQARRGHIGGVRAKHHAVLQGLMAQLDGPKDMRELCHQLTVSPRMLNVLNQPQRVINRRMGVARRDRITNAKQLVAARRIALDGLGPPVNQRLVIHRTVIGTVGF